MKVSNDFLLKRGQDIHVKDHGGPYGCETSRFPHLLDNRLTDGGEVSLTCRSPFTPRKFPVLISVKRMSEPQGHSAAGRSGQLKNPVNQSGIEPATLRLVA
jgi:hypothetical protein